MHDVARGIGLDGRIGRKFLHPGPGYGGSCFPKDTLALVRTAQEAGVRLSIVETVVEVNATRKARMAEKVIEACGGSLAGKTVAVLGLTFKPNTDDMREVREPRGHPGAQARGCDGARLRSRRHGRGQEAPRGRRLVRERLCTLEGADALAILTEWNEFRALDLERMQIAAQGAGRDRLPQHLPSRGDGGRGLPLHLHRPALGRAGVKGPGRMAIAFDGTPPSFRLAEGGRSEGIVEDREA